MGIVIIIAGLGVFIYICNSMGSSDPNIDAPTESPTYVCRGCSVSTPHNQRTLSAAKSGKSGFFCKSCHHKWLEKKKAEQGYTNQGSGCMVVLAVPCLVCLGNYLIF